MQPGKAWYQYEPLGVVLIIGPWNYPIHLVLAPLVGALAAGNCAVLKPSEHTPACSALLAELVPQYLDPEAVAVVEGAADATQALLDQALDHCFFTGGPEIGKAVMAGAAKHLTPVTLELGGKSPVIVADDAKRAGRGPARRLGQAAQLRADLRRARLRPGRPHDPRPLRRRAHQGASTASTTAPTCRWSTTRQAGRIAGLVEKAGGTVARGGKVDADEQAGRGRPSSSTRTPTPRSCARRSSARCCRSSASTRWTTRSRTCSRARSRSRVYLFSESRANEKRVLDEISNGGTVINSLMYHLLVPDLPFGGVGNSGTGAYHGKWGFETFSHRKAVLRRPTWPDPALAYPPYTKIKQWIMRKVF